MFALKISHKGRQSFLGKIENFIRFCGVIAFPEIIFRETNECLFFIISGLSNHLGEKCGASSYLMIHRTVFDPIRLSLEIFP